MSESRQLRQRGGLVTAAIWAVGVGLQFAAPLLRDRVSLSDDLSIGSFLVLRPGHALRGVPRRVPQGSRWLEP